MGLVNLTEWVNLDRLVPVECLRIKALQRASVTASMQREVNHWAEGILWTGSHACLCVPALPFTYEAITLGSSAFEVEAKSGFEVTWCTWRERLNGNLGSTEQAACAECLVSVLVISAKLRKELKVLMSLDVSIYLFLPKCVVKTPAQVQGAIHVTLLCLCAHVQIEAGIWLSKRWIPEFLREKKKEEELTTLLKHHCDCVCFLSQMLKHFDC